MYSRLEFDPKTTTARETGEDESLGPSLAFAGSRDQSPQSSRNMRSSLYSKIGRAWKSFIYTHSY